MAAIQPVNRTERRGRINAVKTPDTAATAVRPPERVLEYASESRPRSPAAFQSPLARQSFEYSAKAHGS